MTSDTIAKTGSLSLAPAQAPIVLPFVQGDIIAGKYEVLGLTGSGGVGYVISAMHVELGELVALKFLRPQALANKELVARFAREARAAARIKSEYVARVYDVGTLPSGEPFIVMEHLEGQDLGTVMRQSGRLTIPRATEYIMQACEGLASAHSLGVVHRDVKPGNLFLARRALGMETIKVLDFGISKVALGANSEDAQAFVQTTMLMGSPSYMSPEQIRACDEVDQRTDIWSLGCVLFEMLTASCVFNAPTLMQLSAAILERNPVPLSAFLPEAPAGLQAVVAKCLEKDPRKRYQNVAELAVALFPFAPPRARLSAERCVMLVNRPPTAPASFDAEAVVADSTRSAPVSTTTPTVLSAQAEHFQSLALARVPSVTMSSQMAFPRPPMASLGEIPSFRPRHRRMQSLAAGGVALVAIGYFVWSDLRSPAPKQVSASLKPESWAPLPTAAARAPEPEERNLNTAVPVTEARAGANAVNPAQPAASAASAASLTAVERSAQGAAAVHEPAHPLPGARPNAAGVAASSRPLTAAPSNVVPARPKSTPRPVYRSEDEPDVGF